MAPIKLYYYYRSPPSRAVLLLINYLDIEYEKIDVDLFAGENLDESFLSINPRHQVPVIDDNGFILTESKAILGYLANSKLSGSTLYPLNPKKRAAVDEQLYYDSGTLFQRLGAALREVIFGGGTEVSDNAKRDILDSLNYLNDLLSNRSYVAGDDLSIADFAIVATIAAIFFMGVNIEDYPEIQRWYEQCKELPGFDENEEGAKALGDLMNEKVDGDTAF